MRIITATGLHQKSSTRLGSALCICKQNSSTQSPTDCLPGCTSQIKCVCLNWVDFFSPKKKSCCHGNRGLIEFGKCSRSKRATRGPLILDMVSGCHGNRTFQVTACCRKPLGNIFCQNKMFWHAKWQEEHTDTGFVLGILERSRPLYMKCSKQESTQTKRIPYPLDSRLDSSSSHHPSKYTHSRNSSSCHQELRQKSYLASLSH